MSRSVRVIRAIAASRTDVAGRALRWRFRANLATRVASWFQPPSVSQGGGAARVPNAQSEPSHSSPRSRAAARGAPVTAPAVPAVAAEAFKRGMRRLAAGVTIITTMHDGERHGLTATAVTSLTTEPPQLLVCVNRTAAAHDLIHRGARLCVNVLAQEHRALAARFAGIDGVHGSERFLEGEWTRLKTGAPVLADAIASFDCEVAETVDVATHTIFIGRVVEVRAREDGDALVYEAGSFGSVQRSG